MTKKTKKSPARKKTQKTQMMQDALDHLNRSKTEHDWVHLGKGTLSIRAMTDAEKAEVASSTEHQLAALRKEVDTLLRAAGGFWTTIDGTLLSIRQMSDNHLKNALLMPTLTESSRGLLLAEQKRREIDRNYAKRDGKRSSNDEIHALGEKIDADAPTVAEVQFMQQVQNDLKLLTKQVDKLTTAHVNSTVKREAPPEGFTIKPIVNGRQTGFRLFDEKGRLVNSGTYDDCLTSAKALSSMRSLPPLPPLQPFEVNGFRLSANLSGRWFARKGATLLAAPSLEEVIGLVKKVTS